MKVIKEFARDPKNLCIIKTKGDRGVYLSVILNLFAEAIKDFPTLRDGEVQVVIYCSGAFGIEFTVPKGKKVPEDYITVKHAEMPK